MKLQYSVSEDYTAENIDILDDQGVKIASFNTQADCPEDNNLSRMGVLKSLEDFHKILTGKDIEVETVPYQ